MSDIAGEVHIQDHPHAESRRSHCRQLPLFSVGKGPEPTVQECRQRRVSDHLARQDPDPQVLVKMFLTLLEFYSKESWNEHIFNLYAILQADGRPQRHEQAVSLLRYPWTF